MKQQKITYEEIMSLGGKRSDRKDDSVFFAQNGFYDFDVTIKLSKRISVDWSNTTHLARITRCDKEQSILSTIPVYDLEDLKRFVHLFKGLVTNSLSGTVTTRNGLWSSIPTKSEH